MSSREEALFTDALALPEAERAAFLDHACGRDEALRARIIALLAGYEAPGSLLTRAAVPRSVVADENAGDFIDRYKLLQKLGEGGCGVVWMAEQETPVRRRVALKVIKLGMDTRAVIARFEAERQALALMDHPNIAMVLDAGATGSGRPFFVMELVRGVPITTFCDEHNLNLTDRLELFVQVCHGVQHAHQKGVIHRDLKPSNILVTLSEGAPMPKVIDFGIAKATQGRLTDATLFTAFDQFIGTPLYMSPEQAEMSSLDVDTRTDIYSLGVLLYELLSGRPPFDPKELTHAGLDGMRQQIREKDPPRPSVRLRTMSAEERTTVARQRGTAVSQLSLTLRGDLDWIVMRCIEKNRTRRYETANALAADLGRYLNHEPVVARPPSTLYRFGKLVRRNRLVFAAGTVVALALVAATIISSRQAARATRAEHVADAERGKAVEVRARADALLAFMIGDLRQRLATVGRLDVLEGVGEQAITYFTSLRPADVNEATRAGHANALTLIGDVRVDQGRYPEALRYYEEAYTRAAALAASTTNADVGTALFARSQAEFGIGNVYWKRTDFARAREWMSKYRASALALTQLDSKNLLWRRELASAYNNLAALAMKRGELDAARQGFHDRLESVRMLMQALPADRELKFQAANTISFLGAIAERTGDLNEALRRFREEVAAYEEIVRLEPRTPRWSFKLAEASSFEADILAAMGRRAAAQEALARAHPLFAAAVALDPMNVRWRVGLQIQQLKEVIVAGPAGWTEATLQRIESTRRALEELAAAEPTDHRIAFRLAMAWRLEAQLRHARGRPDAAAAAARACEVGRTVLHEDADMALEIGEAAHAHIVAGQIASAQRNAAAALRHWDKARELLAPLVGQTKHWRALEPAARVAALSGRSEEAQALISRLAAQGYVPLEPWPKPDAFVLATLPATTTTKPN